MNLLVHDVSRTILGAYKSRLLPTLMIFYLTGLLASFSPVNAWTWANYTNALSKSILFYDGQRSGKLPQDQRLKWRQDSGLADGNMANVDLEGGYYDGADNVKFSFPMAFTTTMLSWSVVEYGYHLEKAGELENLKTAIRWATDYLLKTTKRPNVIYAQVGDPNSDHSCWERPEDMDTPRNVYQVNVTHPGTDLAAEIAAAYAAASMVFETSDCAYSHQLLNAGMQAFQFATNYKGSYSTALNSAVCPFYCSYSGYEDELLWGAAWLYRASKNTRYLEYVLDNGYSLGGTTKTYTALSWDNKYVGVQVLLSGVFFKDKSHRLQPYKVEADAFVCSHLTSYSQRTPGGLIFHDGASNLQYVTTAAFLLFTYGSYLSAASQPVLCGSVQLSSHELWTFAKHQVDYILGRNPMGMSYMVGYGFRFPKRVHHRGSSLPCIRSHPQRIGCKDGFIYLYTSKPNPNLLTGAVVGGPDQYDHYADDRSNYQQSEPTTYINAPLVGALAFLSRFSAVY